MSLRCFPIAFRPQSGRFRARLLSTVALATALIVAGGCSSQPEDRKIPEAGQNIRLVALAYQHAQTGLGRPPRSAAELRPYLAKLGDPTTLLRSPNDGEDYVVVWGIDPKSLHPLATTADAPQQFPIWIHEAKGKDGLHWVFEGRRVHVLTDEQFRVAEIAKKRI